MKVWTDDDIGKSEFEDEINVNGFGDVLRSIKSRMETIWNGEKWCNLVKFAFAVDKAECFNCKETLPRW